MKKILLLLVALALLAGCTPQSSELASARTEHAQKSTGDILIGTTWKWTGPQKGLSDGIDMAIEEINANGGVLGRKLRIVKAEDDGSLARGRRIAEEFAQNTDMVAVVGHTRSDIALPASDVYESSGLLFLTPAKSHKLAERGYKLVFQTAASNQKIGPRLVAYIAAKDHRPNEFPSQVFQQDAYHRFVQTYTERYGHEPGIYSAIGYDTVRLLTKAMQSADSTEPTLVARALRNPENWSGSVIGNYAFD